MDFYFTKQVFVFTGFGLSTFTADTTVSARFQLARMSSSIFANGKIKKADFHYHTPTTFRTQRRLQFASPPTFSSTTPLHPPPPGISPPRTSPSVLPMQDASANSNHLAPAVYCNNSQQQFILPWETPGAKTTSLYKTSAPKILYPAGSRDEDVNKRFIKQMDMYLFGNFQVRSILVGDRPHPFSDYARLAQYQQQQGRQDWTFDTSTTFATMQEIYDNGHTDFHQELYDLLWFGGVLSYGNIMRETYAIMYALISPQDLPDIDGLCEVDDGITFRQVIIKSLRTVRKKHTHEIISRLYNKIDNTKLVMRPGGMAAYFARLNKYRLEMKRYGEIVSEAYLLRRTNLAVSDKHKTLKDAVAEMRRIAGASGVPTIFAKAKDNLIDTFQFETPDSVKTEKSPSTVDVSLAENQAQPQKRRRTGSDPRNNPRRRRVWPKGSCKYCPESTSHSTSECYMTIRKQMGLPSGWQWCTAHKKGTHYDHLCRRHAPNFPPVPKINPIAAVCTPVQDQLPERVLTMLGISAQTPQPLQQQQQNKRQSITITRPNDNPQNFQTARNISTNVAVQGPQVANILESILKMDSTQRDALSAGLSKAGF